MLKSMTYPVDFGRDDDVVSLPAKFLDRLANDFLRFPGGITFSAVEEIDAGIVCGFHAVERYLIADMSSIRYPSAKRDDRDL